MLIIVAYKNGGLVNNRRNGAGLKQYFSEGIKMEYIKNLVKFGNHM